MSDVIKTVLVPYTPAEMFVLVDRVEDYPQFLPWCGRTELHERDAGVTEATLHIDYYHLRQSFTTRNSKRAPEEMQIQLKSGPFRRMEGGWLFHPLGDAACKIEFRLHYTFANAAFDTLLGPVFGYIAGSLVDSFIQRAEQVYGER
ncbi:MAG: type II toxin-antitoxin system RatA family toxin [Betaproteobacteria bacterium]|nr:MAG: type II toxin-antitoxin system RatA family toxin [Betaproteobacteria bacterium]